ncbi:transcriptional repressor [Saliniramus sp.]|uniref:transcriptional repressor n=1 Tax=Saliniramus sp. TaxID=2986772 RepID=UPI002BE00937|nr:transcriptional repressor [Saliniramus sp.]HMB09028.1 transcriptional repressor [Saliniramus sp.]
MVESHSDRGRGHDHHDRDHDHDGAPCRHARERAAEAGEALARAEAICGERRQRLTPMRRAVLGALYDTHKPVGAYEIIDILGPQEGKTLAPITIYRALDFLIAQGFVHRLASRNAFIACPHGHGPEELVAFLICDACGGVDERCAPPLSQALGQMLSAEQFKPRHPVLEISGLCGHCSEKQGDA